MCVSAHVTPQHTSFPVVICILLLFFFLLYCCVCVVRGSVGPVISDYAEKAATEHRR